MTGNTRKRYIIVTAMGLVGAAAIALAHGLRGAHEYTDDALPTFVTQLYFTDADCAGRAKFSIDDVIAAHQERPKVYLAPDNFEYVAVAGTEATTTVASVLEDDGCRNYEKPLTLMTVDTLALRYDGE